MGDYRVREKWDDYREAYQDVITKCNSRHSPWFVIPSGLKWYRDAAVAGIVHQTMKDMNPGMPPVAADLDEIRALYERELMKLNDHRQRA